MSKSTTEVKILKQSEINKKIIANTLKLRPHEDLLGPFDRYNDENYQTYDKKKKQFFDCAKNYNRLNQETLICWKKRLHEDYRENLECEFLKELFDEGIADKNKLLMENGTTKGKFVRKRTVRQIHEARIKIGCKSKLISTVRRYNATVFLQVAEPIQNICSLEPWFKKHLLLNKFIWAARTVIIKNRLLNNLEKLKKIDEAKLRELEKQGPKIHNVSYGDVFNRFLK